MSESMTVAQYQAARLRELLGVTTPAMPLEWVPELPKLTVEIVPAYRLEESVSGVTSYQNGLYRIAINKNRSRTHRRFTLCHELKHLIDYPYARIWHAGLGYGDDEARDRRIERLADHFAVHLLMPTSFMKRAYGCGIQEPRALSELFAVSEPAIRIRLDNLGLTGETDLPAAMYFRRTTISARLFAPPA
jgi:Zn-dependent peptidase ImmA (M78 family)